MYVQFILQSYVKVQLLVRRRPHRPTDSPNRLPSASRGGTLIAVRVDPSSVRRTRRQRRRFRAPSTTCEHRGTAHPPPGRRSSRFIARHAREGGISRGAHPLRVKPEGRARAPGEHARGLSRRRNDFHRVETTEAHLGPARTPLVHERRVARCRSAALPVSIVWNLKKSRLFIHTRGPHGKELSRGKD